MQSEDRSLLQLLAKGYSANSCGYCKDADTGKRSPDTSGAYYMATRTMTVETYQELVDRGWRRSGTLLYKPDVLRSCCPHYTIRLPAAEYKPSKDHRQAFNRWNKHVLGDQYVKEKARKYPLSKQEKKEAEHHFDLIKTVHEAEASNLCQGINSAHAFVMQIEEDTFTEEKFLLFRDYQMSVHHERENEVTRKGFRRFLCESPLRRKTITVNGKQQKLGSHHYCYRLNGRLIAMGVLDLMPHAVSGVYFMYHSDFAKWSFGKLSAMAELALTIEGQYQYYYMGFYIHDCVKMRYKADFRPQMVLHPLTYEWLALDTYRTKLDLGKYAALDIENPHQDGSRLFLGPNGIKWKYGTPAEVDDSEKSLLQVGMPGVLSAKDVKSRLDLGSIWIHLGRRGSRQIRELTIWDEDEEFKTKDSLKGQLAEMAACIGSEVATTMALDFT